LERYSTREACRILGIANRTIRRWIKEGRIRAVNVNGRWRIPESEVKRILGQPVSEVQPPRLARVVIYARVSGSSQRAELDSQVEALKKYAEERGWSIVGVVWDIASGINEDRRGLWRLVEMAKRHEFDVLLVAYRDRLTRFGFRYLEELFKSHGVKVEVAFQETPRDYYQELVEDMIEVVTSFASKMYGERSHKYRKVVEAVEQAVKDP
jgi:excisionase family DNA binding protein